jgi:hypothetical protein
MTTTFLLITAVGGDYLKDVGAYARIILKLLFKKDNARLCVGIIWFSTRTSGGFL